MELSSEHYRLAAVAYDAYCEQTGGKSLVSGEKLPAFESLRREIKDAWAASAIALSLDAERAIRSLTHRAEFGDQCYQDRCENAYVEQTVMKKAVAEAEKKRTDNRSNSMACYMKQNGRTEEEIDRVMASIAAEENEPTPESILQGCGYTEGTLTARVVDLAIDAHAAWEERDELKHRLDRIYGLTVALTQSDPMLIQSSRELVLKIAELAKVEDE